MTKSLFNKDVRHIKSAILLKRDSNVDVPCDICEIFKKKFLVAPVICNSIEKPWGGTADPYQIL